MDQLSSEPSEVAFSRDMPFLDTSISHIGLSTPPASPEDAKPNRFPLPKFLRGTQSTRSRNFLAQNISSNKRPLYLTFSRAHNTPLYASSSPFRAVRHMREPFPLVLPTSPKPNGHSTNGMSPCERLQKDRLGDQCGCAFQPEEQPPFKALKPVALLPSPIFPTIQPEQTSGSYFASLISDEQPSPDGPRQPLSLYEEHDILSGYYDGDESQACSRTIEDTNEASPNRTAPAIKQRHDARRDVGIVCALSSFPQYQKCPRRDRPRSYSSEADWLAGNMSEKVMLEERLPDLHWSAIPANNQEEDDRGDHHQTVRVKPVRIPCMVLTRMQVYATQLKGAERPKIVNISRPKSPSTTPTSMLRGLRSADQPNTPARLCQEISVFSPDTPVKYSPKPLRWSATSLRITPLTPQCSRQETDLAPRVSPPACGQRIRDSLEPWPTKSQDTPPAEASPYTIRNPIRTPTPVLSTTFEAGARSGCEKLESILEAASRAVDTFPEGMLRLDSDVMLALRNPHSQDDILIDALQRIFPQTASLLLSALAALLLLDSYFSNLKEMSTSFNNTPSRHPRRKFDRLAARSIGCLRDIPIKERATLGIHSPNVTVLPDRERAWRTTAEIVNVCVRVQGQKLLEAICGRFDEVVWRALKVVVTTVESTSSRHIS
jgi:hypothetical protein